MIATYIIDGVKVITGGHPRRVTWMSDWSRADELADRALLYRRHYGPSTYGHSGLLRAGRRAPRDPERAGDVAVTGRCWCDHEITDHWFLYSLEHADPESRCLECACRDFEVQPELFEEATV